MAQDSVVVEDSATAEARAAQDSAVEEDWATVAQDSAVEEDWATVAQDSEAEARAAQDSEAVEDWATASGWVAQDSAVVED